MRGIVLVLHELKLPTLQCIIGENRGDKIDMMYKFITGKMIRTVT